MLLPHSCTAQCSLHCMTSSSSSSIRHRLFWHIDENSSQVLIISRSEKIPVNPPTSRSTMTSCNYLLFIILFTTTLLTFSSNAKGGETHLVGGDQGWTQFPNYTLWGLGNTFQVGDTLVFNYAQELHNVVQVNETAYDQCLRDPNLGLLQSGNDSVILQEAGQIWYICGLGDHCENGQKLSIRVLP